ncbi:hypothetical protein C8Q73DRAFT_2735 [Cubamyces lactineus]|nr:hypothetical protein C8Q73DRAFT_2735 [Cubamyces lactineus]
MLTGVLTVTLHRSRTGFQPTDSLIDTLILYSVCTGLITNVFSLLGFIIALVLPNDMLYIMASIITTKLYVNCVLAALNTRKSLLADSIGTSTVEFTTRADVTLIFARAHDRSTVSGGGGMARSLEPHVVASARDRSCDTNFKGGHSSDVSDDASGAECRV